MRKFPSQVRLRPVRLYKKLTLAPQCCAEPYCGGLSIDHLPPFEDENGCKGFMRFCGPVC